MDWLLILVVAAGLAVLTRIFMSVRKYRQDQAQDWDAKVLTHLRAQGVDPFSPQEVDFFFALPDDRACRTVGSTLEADGFAVTSKSVPANEEFPRSLHATKTMRLSIEEMRELSRRFTRLASENHGRYDGWTASRAARS